VRPRWRRLGLGEALLRESFREFHRRGERRVALAVDVENPTGATRLYERVGMRPLWEAVVYRKQLP
jgi:ribosomal protein S18 acetylase RimI-like enzyme